MYKKRRTRRVLNTLVTLLVVTAFALLPVTVNGGHNPRLHYKSQINLMPPAYGASETQRAALTSTGSVLFDPDVVYPSDSWPEASAVGEWTGDGRPDVALITSFANDTASDRSLHIFAQETGGTLTPTMQIATGAGPMAMASGDFNRDGLDDLAVVNHEDDTLGVYLQSAPGTFAPVVTYTTGVAPDAIAVGDFNTDLRQDIAVSHAESQSVAIFYQQSNGTLENPVYLSVGSAGFNDLVMGDLNSDGYDDLVLLRGAGYSTDEVAIFYQQEGALTLPVYRSVQTGGFLPHGLAVGDVTNDGRDDIVVTAGGNTPQAYLNVLVQGDNGVLSATPVTYPAYHLPEAVEIGDVNHDGRNDVVLVHAAWLSLSTYLQQENGTLAPYVSDSLPYADFYRPGALTLADVSGDGALDVALASHSSQPEENGLVILSNATGSAPTSTITTPALGALITDMDATHYLIEGTASADAVTLQISTDGGLTWHEQPANTEWSYNWALPEEDGSYVILVRAVDGAGRVQSLPARTRIIIDRTIHVYLPLVASQYVGAPDLVVQSLQATTSGVGLQVKNVGTASTTESFWVDIYIDPAPAPTSVNQIWSSIAAQGGAWGVSGVALHPGEILTLTTGDDYYADTYSEINWPLTVGAQVYAQVDSAHVGSEFGAVRETHEILGGTYNNVIGPVGVIASTTVVLDTDAQRYYPNDNLPERP
jgi:hypothetical protein